MTNALRFPSLGKSARAKHGEGNGAKARGVCIEIRVYRLWRGERFPLGDDNVMYRRECGSREPLCADPQVEVHKAWCGRGARIE